MDSSKGRGRAGRGREKGDREGGVGRRERGKAEEKKEEWWGEVGRDMARMKQELSISPAFCSRPTAFSFRITERFACSG